jgi:hypothetical protein
MLRTEYETASLIVEAWRGVCNRRVGSAASNSPAARVDQQLHVRTNAVVLGQHQPLTVDAQATRHSRHPRPFHSSGRHSVFPQWMAPDARSEGDAHDAARTRGGPGTGGSCSCRRCAGNRFPFSRCEDDCSQEMAAHASNWSFLSKGVLAATVGHAGGTPASSLEPRRG